MKECFVSGKNGDLWWRHPGLMCKLKIYYALKILSFSTKCKLHHWSLKVVYVSMES